MQNQPGPDPRKHDPAGARHDRQAAGLSEDAFKGGSAKPAPRRLSWLRSPWKPAASRLWPGKDEPADE
jgi:hypothetical protein